MQRRNRLTPLSIRPSMIALMLLLPLLAGTIGFVFFSDKAVTISAGIDLPVAHPRVALSPSILVQVSPSKMWVDGRTVLDANLLPGEILDADGTIRPLWMALEARKKELLFPQHSTMETVQLAIDQSLKFSYVSKLLKTCQKAGFINQVILVNPSAR